jgi:integrase
MWRRLLLIPFTMRFWDPDLGETGPPELRAVKPLLERLKGELPGILAWAVEGCLEWQRDGLQIPQAVLTASATYRSDRAMFYTVVTSTGFRAAEIASLIVLSLQLDHAWPSITVTAAYSKRRRNDVQPIRADLAATLREWLAERAERQDSPASDGRLWPGTWYQQAAEMLRRDLGNAEVDFEDAAGCRLDFHALRHTFISNLSKAEVHPRKAQQLARHSTIDLTMNSYTHLSLADAAAELDKLPPLPSSTSDKQPPAVQESVVTRTGDIERDSAGSPETAVVPHDADSA